MININIFVSISSLGREVFGMKIKLIKPKQKLMVGLLFIMIGIDARKMKKILIQYLPFSRITCVF